jgi:hypothetical protein
VAAGPEPALWPARGVERESRCGASLRRFPLLFDLLLSLTVRLYCVIDAVWRDFHSLSTTLFPPFSPRRVEAKNTWLVNRIRKLS